MFLESIQSESTNSKPKQDPYLRNNRLNNDHCILVWIRDKSLITVAIELITGQGICCYK